jgi:hypothetical protein
MIKTISFLVSESERKHVPCVAGTFVLKKKKHTLIKTKEIRKKFTAKDLVLFVRDRDPVITLNTGEKFRVYRGGDPTSEVISTVCIIESHDEEVARMHREEEELREKILVPDFHGYLDWPGDDGEGW